MRDPAHRAAVQWTAAKEAGDPKKKQAAGEEPQASAHRKQGRSELRDGEEGEHKEQERLPVSGAAGRVPVCRNRGNRTAVERPTGAATL